MSTSNVDLKSHAMGGVGAKLMTKMGWSGIAGIGKFEQGCREPIQILHQFARHGLGSISVDKNFNKIARSIIEDYANSDEEQDLVFATNLSIQQRKFIHKIAGHFNLRHVSYGKGGHRQLTIQKRKSAQQLVEYLLSVGGEDGKYRLIFPNRSQTV